MEREVNLPHQLFDKRFAALPASSSSSSSLSSSLQSVPDCLRHAQAAFKRPRTLGMLTSGIGGARRVLVAQTEPSKSANPDPCVDGCASGNQCQDRRAEMDSHTGCSLLDSEKAGDLVSRHDSVEQISTEKAMFDQRKRLVGAEVTPTDASLAGQNEKIGAFGSKQCSGLVVSDSALNDLISADQHNTFVGSNLDGKRDTGSSYRLPGKASNTVHYQGQPSETISTYGPKKVHFSVVGNASEGSKGDLSNGRVENKQTIGSDPIINYMHGLVRSKDLLTSTSEDGHGSLISASQRADEQMATDTGMESLSSYMNSLALTEGGSSMSNPVGPSTINDQDSKKQGFQHTKIGGVVCSEEMSKLIGTRSVGSGLSATRNTCIQDQCFMGFLGEEAINPTTLSSVAGSMRTSSSFMPPTATSVQCTSAAPRPNSTTYSSCSQMEMGPSEEFNPGNQGIPALPSRPSTSPALGGQPAASIQASSASALVTSSVFQSSFQNESAGLADGRLDHAKALQLHDKSNKGKPCLYHQSGGGDRNVQSQLPQTKGDSLNVNLEPSQSSHPEKVISGGSSVPRRKHYDPDGFFKVNGKLYQKLGRIGRGGSSEVHKVISSDCTIYALKKIKLKGRDYSTAYGFCQEIEYLNKLQGKSNIIQLVDYEVTCKGLLQEVLNGSMTTKDGSIKDDAYIYMVLEYGEIDLAHMLSQKWRDMGSSGWHIDENWLRFYWQQILHAVNTIHEERIVHSDLKPANFLLVKGVLKLIDFGIAKAIMSDTTNIQRDTQVGTLNYMSPEAFMCNDHDANGNTIKCGRPSDIWSLGCILYQMVYGKTPFAEYTSFWPKFKVITDPNHQISYDLVPNPWLLDLMKKCLAWDRNQRWRIPQLLQHPFLVPPVPPCSLPPSPKDHQEHYKLLLQISQEYGDVPEVSSLCSRLQQLLQKINCSKPPSMSHC